MDELEKEKARKQLKSLEKKVSFMKEKWNILNEMANDLVNAGVNLNIYPPSDDRNVIDQATSDVRMGRNKIADLWIKYGEELEGLKEKLKKEDD